MQLVGRRTYAVCIVIIMLAACQKFLAIQIPSEVWIMLFGLVAMTLRAAVSPSAKLLLALAIPALLLSACSTINVNLGDEAITAASGCATNAVCSASEQTTNNTRRVTGTASIMVVINMNAAKDIKPDSTLSLTK